MSSSEPTTLQIEAVDQVARFLVRFGLTIPAILMLESIRPLSVVGSQFMHLLSPSIAVFLSPHHFDALAQLLEKRDGLNHMIQRIEELDMEKRS